MVTEPQDDSAWMLRCVDACGRGVGVAFFRQEDRYAHRIDWLDAAAVHPGLISQEGGAEEHWPPSPPLQHLRCEEPAPGRRILLLVGMAGRTHWSLSVEADERSASLLFDVACRVVNPPHWVGSTYRVPGTCALAADGLARFGSASGAGLLTVEPLDSQPPPALTIGADRLHLAVRGSGVAVPATLRWKYRIAYRADSRTTSW
jgi:hypothetical protein